MQTEQIVAMTISIILIIATFGVFALLIQRQNFKLAGEFLAQANTNKALLDSIEGTTSGVPQNVVQGILAIANMALGASSDPDLKKAIEEFKKLIIQVTDKLPNNPPADPPATTSLPIEKKAVG